MNKDRTVLTFEADKVMDSFDVLSRVEGEQAPIGFRDLGSFFETRRPPGHNVPSGVLGGGLNQI